MSTVLIGQDTGKTKILLDTLEQRGHLVNWLPQNNPNMPEETELVVYTGTLDVLHTHSRVVRNMEMGEGIMIVAVISRKDVANLSDSIFEHVDEIILESADDPDRLHARLAFIEKAANHQRERFRAEQLLKDSEVFSRTILEATVDGIITIDTKGIVHSYNPAAHKIFEYSEVEVLGNNIKMLMPDPYKEEHDDYLEHYLETGQRKIIGIGREVTGRRKSGDTFPMYLAVSEMEIRGKRMFTGLVRDISEQRALEQAILRTTEHERRRIGQDLHDGLGQMLTGIGLMSQNLTKKLEKENNGLHEKSDEITSLIKEADEYARALSRGLVPVEFDNNGLSAGMQRLIRSAKKMFGITCDYKERNAPVFRESLVVEHLYRIAQEAVSNAVKHGKAGKIKISLIGGNEHVRLRIIDDGVGFDNDWENSDGMGVKIMQFRARLVGASVEIRSTPGKGSSVTCTLPRSTVPYTLPEN